MRFHIYILNKDIPKYTFTIQRINSLSDIKGKYQTDEIAIKSVNITHAILTPSSDYRMH